MQNTSQISAYYTVSDTREWHPIDTNGDTLEEATADMLDFWNEVAFGVEEFVVNRIFRPDDFTVITEITGAVYGYTDGEVDEDKTDTIAVQIIAEEE